MSPERLWRWLPPLLVGADLLVFVLMRTIWSPLVVVEYAVRLLVLASGLVVARHVDPQWWRVVGGPSGDRWRELRFFVFSSLGMAGVAVLFVAAVAAWGVARGEPFVIGPSEIPRWGPLWYFFLYGVILAPLQEEVVYRGILLGPMRGQRPGWEIVVLSGVVFSLLHLVYGRPTITAPYYFAAGGILGWVYLRGGHLWIAVAIHAGGNTAVAVKDLLIMFRPEWLAWIPGLRFEAGL